MLVILKQSYVKLTQLLVIQKQLSGGVLQKGALKNFIKFTGKQLCKSLFFNKVAGLKLAILLKENSRVQFSED